IAAGGDVMECAGEVGAKCSCHAPRLPRDGQEGSKLFTLEPKRGQTSSERKLPATTGRDSGLGPKKEGAAPRVASCLNRAHHGIGDLTAELSRHVLVEEDSS